MIIGIVAVARNRAIGKDGKLPWHFSSDLKFFKRTTTGNAVAMGFTTWKSLGRPLPNRLNIVLSRSRRVDPAPDLVFLASTEELVSLSRYLHCDLFVIGGAKTYESVGKHIDRWIVSEIPLEVEGGDVFMPSSFLDGFQKTGGEEPGEGVKVSIYDRVAEEA